MKIKSYGLTDVGLQRKDNQDYFIINNDLQLSLVADGMGGEAGGAFASRITAETMENFIVNFFRRKPDANEVEIINCLKDATLAANKAVFKYSIENPELKGMGSTLSLVLLRSGYFFIAQVGDSRVYLFRKRKLIQLTKDQSLVWALYEKGIITKEELETHPQKNVLLNCMGNKDDIKFEIKQERVETGDILLICSDGLSGPVKDNVIESIMNEDDSIENRARKLIETALANGGPDNVTVCFCQVVDATTNKVLFDAAEDIENAPTDVSALLPDADKTKKVRPTMGAPKVIMPPPAPTKATDSKPAEKKRNPTLFLIPIVALIIIAVIAFAVFGKKSQPTSDDSGIKGDITTPISKSEPTPKTNGVKITPTPRMESTPTPAITYTPTPIITPQITPPITPTPHHETPAPVVKPEITPEPTIQITPAPTMTEKPTFTPTPKPTHTPRITPTLTATPAPSATPTALPTQTSKKASEEKTAPSRNEMVNFARRSEKEFILTIIPEIYIGNAVKDKDGDVKNFKKEKYKEIKYFITIDKQKREGNVPFSVKLPDAYHEILIDPIISDKTEKTEPLKFEINMNEDKEIKPVLLLTKGETEWTIKSACGYTDLIGKTIDLNINYKAGKRKIFDIKFQSYPFQYFVPQKGFTSEVSGKDFGLIPKYDIIMEE